jgi:hypothetical protein
LSELYELKLDLFSELRFGSADVCQPAARLGRQYLLQRELLLNIVLSAEFLLSLHLGRPRL